MSDQERSELIRRAKAAGISNPTRLSNKKLAEAVRAADDKSGQAPFGRTFGPSAVADQSDREPNTESIGNIQLPRD